MMIDIACTWNQGLNAGPAARQVLGVDRHRLGGHGVDRDRGMDFLRGPWSIAARGTGWIHSFWMAAPGRYQVPDLFVKVANDRAKPFVYRGAIPAMGKDSIRRLVYHSPGYTLSSQRDGAPGPAAARSTRRRGATCSSGSPTGRPQPSPCAWTTRAAPTT
ncbi:MAG: hypothetical protein U1F87_09475 [Kiritimatiellia bacterium]